MYIFLYHNKKVTYLSKSKNCFSQNNLYLVLERNLYLEIILCNHCKFK